MQNPTFRNTAKQQQAIELISQVITTLLEGGSRSGKTAIIIKAIYIRATKYPGTDHCIMRFRFNHAKLSLWYGTLPKVANLLGIYDALEFNKSDWFIKLPNGSRIWLGGLDDKERLEKILGNEYATIYVNEASQISFDGYEILTTRLNAPPGVPPKFFIDYNPPSTSHWGFRIFHKREFPDGRPVPKDDYKWLKMNPIDNLENLSENYMQILNNLSSAKKKRFMDGDYGSDEGALWKRAWIKYQAADIEHMRRIVVGVDPSGSENGDEVGIIVVGYDGKNYFVFDDFTLNGTPKEWSDEVMLAYDKYKGDCIAAEKNFGGQMVESTITDMGRRKVKVKLVNASRGKAVRAEPVSAMYERGNVFHVKELPALEDEMCTWKPNDENAKSPNRIDAAVWALTELSGGRPSLFDVVG